MDQDNGNDWRSIFTRILGDSLTNFVGQSVLLIAEVVNVHPSGASMVVKTTDNKTVNVRFPAPETMDPPEGLVELRGTVVSNSALNCDDYIKFGIDPQEFDAETYSDAVRMILQGGTAWNRK